MIIPKLERPFPYWNEAQLSIVSLASSRRTGAMNGWDYFCDKRSWGVTCDIHDINVCDTVGYIRIRYTKDCVYAKWKYKPT